MVCDASGRPYLIELNPSPQLKHTTLAAGSRSRLRARDSVRTNLGLASYLTLIPPLTLTLTLTLNPSHTPALTLP